MMLDMVRLELSFVVTVTCLINSAFLSSSDSDKVTSESSSDASENEESLSSTSEDKNDVAASSSVSSESGSSAETAEARIARRRHRECHKCISDEDLVKRKYKGIKWICGGYQQARRTFASECMMRFRNCEDGTMFVKIFNRKCPDNLKELGHHWFYEDISSKKKKKKF